MMIHTPRATHPPKQKNTHTHTNNNTQNHPTPTLTPHLSVCLSEKYERETITTTNLVFVCVFTAWLCVSVYRKLQQVQVQQQEVQQRTWILTAEAGVQSVREDRKKLVSLRMVQRKHIQVVDGQPQMQQFVYYNDSEDGLRERRRGCRGIWVRSFLFLFFFLFLQMGGCLLLLWCSWKDDHHQ